MIVGPGFGVGLGEGRVFGKASVVDQHVDGAEFLEGGLDLSRVANVGNGMGDGCTTGLQLGGEIGNGWHSCRWRR